MTAAQGPEHGTGRVAGRLQQARGELLGGRGPGADDAEIAAHTRNRAAIAGIGTTRRLELAARQTARARGDESAISDDVERAAGELAHTVAVLADRLNPKRIVQREQVRMDELVARHAPAVIAAAVLAGVLFALGWVAHRPDRTTWR